jgi:hypothetical protein
MKGKKQQALSLFDKLDAKVHTYTHTHRGRFMALKIFNNAEQREAACIAAADDEISSTAFF